MARNLDGGFWFFVARFDGIHPEHDASERGQDRDLGLQNQQEASPTDGGDKAILSLCVLIYLCLGH